MTNLQQQNPKTIVDLVCFIQCLCIEMDMPTPRISATKRRRRAVYKRRNREIAFAGDMLTHPGKDPKYVAVHEFAHHVDEIRRSQQVGQGMRRSSHDRVFYKILLEVIDKAYSSRSDYPWWREYKTLEKWATYDLYTRRANHANANQA